MKPVNFYLIRGLAREAVHWGFVKELLCKQVYVKQVICLDLPGFGKFHNLTSPFTVQENAEFAITQIDFNDNTPKMILSISLGSMVAVEILNKKPVGFVKAFVINTSFSDLSPFHHRLQLKSLKHFVNILRETSIRNRERHILKMVSQDQSRWNELLPAFEKAFCERPYTFSNVIRQLLAASRYKLPNAKPEVPLVVLNSLGDQMVSPSCSQKLADYWSLPLLTHPTAGHDIGVDDPQWVVDVIGKSL